MRSVDAIIVGAGAAGIGMAIELNKIAGLEFGVLERDSIGASFRRWPKQTRFITPSFYSNPFGLADLNSVDAGSSPSVFAGAEHLSGPQYADYLTFVANVNQLPIATDCKVLKVAPHPDVGFYVGTELGELFTRSLIWACGEYGFPDLKPFPGADYCQHYAQIDDWQSMGDGSYIVVGGYESGLDSAYNLVKLGHQVRLLVKRATWDLTDVYDPSQVLSPYTRERLREIESSDQLEIVYDAEVVEVSKLEEKDKFRVTSADGRYWDTENPPILGTGFQKGGGARQIKALWDWDENGNLLLNEFDESTKSPGLFLVGPQVRQEQRIYCFIYKFRQRFALIANQIAERSNFEIQKPEGSNDGVWGPFGNSECCEGCEC